MGRLKDSLLAYKFKGKEDEDFLMWSVRIFSVIQGKIIVIVVLGSKVELHRSDIEAYSLYQGK